MGRAVKDLGAVNVKLLNSPSPKSNSPKKGLLRLALDLGILWVIGFWKKYFGDEHLNWFVMGWVKTVLNLPVPKFWKRDHLGALSHSGRLFAGFMAGAFFCFFECHFCSKSRIFIFFEQNDSTMISKSRIIARNSILDPIKFWWIP